MQTLSLVKRNFKTIPQPPHPISNLDYFLLWAFAFSLISNITKILTITVTVAKATFCWKVSCSSGLSPCDGSVWFPTNSSKCSSRIKTGGPRRWLNIWTTSTALFFAFLTAQTHACRLKTTRIKFSHNTLEPLILSTSPNFSMYTKTFCPTYVKWKFYKVVEPYNNEWVMHTKIKVGTFTCTSMIFRNIIIVQCHFANFI